MTRHMNSDESLEDFRRTARLHVEAINHATRDIPARYAQLVGLENVIAGSDCGFATLASFLAIDPGITWAKLGAMAGGARLASDSLW